MKYVFVALLVVLCAVMAYGATEQPDLDDYSLLKCIDKSEVVFVGTVQLLSYHARDNIVYDGGSMLTTDVLVRVDTLIKGTPNTGSRYVKFMIQGGTAFIPSENEVLTLDVSSEPSFEVGEKVMLFMTTSIAEDDYYTNYLYDRLHVILYKYGKRAVSDEKTNFAYKRDSDSVVPVEMPLDLTVELAKAAVANKDAVVPLENQIKALARGATSPKIELSSTLVTQLKSSARTIIQNAEDD